MTPKEIAYRFYHECYDTADDACSVFVRAENAKKKAVIKAEEMIAENVEIGYGFGNIKNDHWYQVIEEIEKL